MAKAAQLEVKTARHPAVSVFVNPRKMPDGQKSLPEYVEASKGHTRWRHPVFGNRDVWVQQPPNKYFTPSVRDAEALAMRECENVNKDNARDLQGTV